MKPAAFFLLSGILFFASCSISQNIVLNPDGSGSVSSSVHLEDFYLTALEDLTDLGGGGEDSRLAPRNITAELSLNPFFSDIEVLSSEKGVYRGHLQFRDIEALFSVTGQNRENPVVAYIRRGDRHSLTFRINHRNFPDLFSLFPALQDPGFQYFLPEQDISAREYKEALVFIFEDRENEAFVKKQLDKAFLDLTIQVKGDILEHQGGTLEGKRKIRFILPLLKLLLHKEEIHYSLTYKANQGE